MTEVAAAGINPGEIAIRNGAMEAMFPVTFPCCQGSDFAGRVVDTSESGCARSPQVRAACTELAGGHVHGKIVLSTVMPANAPPRRG